MPILCHSVCSSGGESSRSQERLREENRAVLQANIELEGVLYLNQPLLTKPPWQWLLIHPCSAKLHLQQALALHRVFFPCTRRKMLGIRAAKVVVLPPGGGPVVLSCEAAAAASPSDGEIGALISPPAALK